MRRRTEETFAPRTACTPVHPSRPMRGHVDGGAVGKNRAQRDDDGFGKVDAVERAVRIDQHLIARAVDMFQRRPKPLKLVRRQGLEEKIARPMQCIEHRLKTASGAGLFPAQIYAAAGTICDVAYRLVAAATYVANAAKLVSFAPIRPHFAVGETLAERKQHDRIIERTRHIPARVELVRRLVIERFEIAGLHGEARGGAARAQIEAAARDRASARRPWRG